MRTHSAHGVVLATSLLFQVGCSTSPNARPVFDFGLGGGAHGFGGSVGLLEYVPHGWSGFGSMSFSGPLLGFEPEYAPGTAASFGDPMIGQSTSAVGFAGGITYSFGAEGSGSLIGLHFGPAISIESTYNEFDDPTGILEQGLGSYWEEEDTRTVGGLVVGAHVSTTARYVVGVSYDSSNELIALRFGWTP